MSAISDSTILVIDSGLGGVSILNALKKKLPDESFIYFADYAFLPYGEKSEAEIKERCINILKSVGYENIKAVVLACNSATASAISYLRKTFDLEFFGTEPGIKPASKESKLGIAVLATSLTLRSEQFARLIKDYPKNTPVYPLPAPELVSLVESGEWQDTGADLLIDNIIGKIEGDFDTLLLGCTHFSFLNEILKKKLGPSVNIIDTSDAIAARVHDKLNEKGLLAQKGKEKTNLNLRYSVSDDQKLILDKKLILLSYSVAEAFNVEGCTEQQFLVNALS